MASCKQKVNIKSSTKAELVTIDNVMELYVQQSFFTS